MHLFTGCMIWILLIFTMSDGGLTNQVCYDEPPVGDIGCFSNDPPFNNANDELPDAPSVIKTKAYLWTKQNPDTPDDISNIFGDSLWKTHLNHPPRPTKILIHGFMDSNESDVISKLRVALLKTGDFNVIGIDWSEGAKPPYAKAVANTRVVAALLTALVLDLNMRFRMKLSDLHIIGHGMGAHLSGYVGAKIRGIGRITGLDPAGPMFDNENTITVRLNLNAEFVDVIHTAAAPRAGFGTMLPMGHIDFYPNGGQVQPGCPTPVFNFSESFSSNKSCAHFRAVSYFIESVLNTTCKFTAKQCFSWSDFENNKCDTTSNVMGMHVHAKERTAQGRFYLRTNDQSPFCDPSGTPTSLATNPRSFSLFTLLMSIALVRMIAVVKTDERF